MGGGGELSFDATSVVGPVPAPAPALLGIAKPLLVSPVTGRLVCVIVASEFGDLNDARRNAS